MIENTKTSVASLQDLKGASFHPFDMTEAKVIRSTLNLMNHDKVG
jgi:hypothetical protein